MDENTGVILLVLILWSPVIIISFALALDMLGFTFARCGYMFAAIKRQLDKLRKWNNRRHSRNNR